MGWRFLFEPRPERRVNRRLQLPNVPLAIPVSSATPESSAFPVPSAAVRGALFFVVRFAGVRLKNSRP